MKFEEKLDQYGDRFEDMFPLMELQGYSREEKEALLDECLEKGKTYHELYPMDSKVNY